MTKKKQETSCPFCGAARKHGSTWKCGTVTDEPHAARSPKCLEYQKIGMKTLITGARQSAKDLSVWANSLAAVDKNYTAIEWAKNFVIEALVKMQEDRDALP